MPTSFPGYSTDGNRIDAIEQAFKEELGYPNLIPYIQKYEFETLLFADTAGFSNIALAQQQIDDINAIVQKYPNIEDINGGPDTAPSKRLGSIFNYNKVTDSQIILKDISIETLLARSARFGQWVERLKEIF